MTQDQNARIAIVDDYEKAAETIAAYVRRMGCTPVVFTNPLDFLDELKKISFDIVITDIRMPQMNGISLLKKIKKRAPKTKVIVMSAHVDKKDAIEALKYGAYDFFEKPVGKAELVSTINRTMEHEQAVRERDVLAEKLSLVTDGEAKKWGIQAFIGKSPAMQEIVEKIHRLQESSKTNVLVLGESGTGKELVARAIHFGSGRAKGPFLAINCSAIPNDLAESILFGHAKGSFTGATADRKGPFELADGGTLFLDEIGDMSSFVQTKLLRVLEDGVVIPVGKTDGKKVDVRVVSATNTDIQERTTSNKFRSDLYHRLAAYVVTLPPLRERAGDLPQLVDHFVSLLAEEMGISRPKVDKSFIDSLKRHPFPGNVRELRNVLERALIDAAGKDLCVEHLQLPSESAVQRLQSQENAGANELATSESLPFNLEEAEALLIKRTVSHANGNVSEASRLLGISRAKIYRFLD